ncbi:hypothetical protein CYMTET_8811 [Cymbomonas tetramitiformis]|uniref:Uncharacterized protein n=1 Tax=Cymbomonas tetramitiformis TaxID=36881 RepID=A0AAE0GSJ7_9CHLO|nr:hypothetical protein CYMTET_8811 [Cymbomonas tetramitiformis]
MADAHVGAAMMAPGAAARNVEESKVATYGDVPPHQLVTFGVGVYGGLGPAAVAFLKRTQWRFSGRRYLAEDAVEADEVDEEGDEEGSGGEDARAGRGGSMGWKVRWVRQLSFALAWRVVYSTVPGEVPN